MNLVTSEPHNYITERTQAIHAEIDSLYREGASMVQRAIRIGKNITEVKEALGHGEFLPWLSNNFNMSERTARRYMAVYAHRDKTATLSDLQEAYKRVEQVEYQEKKAQEKADIKLVMQKKETGEKPDGWERRHDYLYKQICDDEEFEKRRKAKMEEIKLKTLPKGDGGLSEIIDDMFKGIKQFAEQQQATERIRLDNYSDTATQNAIIEAIRLYLEREYNISRRIELSQNLIKWLRGYTSKLQQQTVGN